MLFNLRFHVIYVSFSVNTQAQALLALLVSIHAIHAIHHVASSSFSVDAVCHDVFDGLFTQQGVEFTQFCQAFKRLVSVMEIERAIVTFWILEN